MDPAVPFRSESQRFPSGPGGMGSGEAVGGGRRVLVGRTGGGIDHADLGREVLGEPEIAIRAGRDLRRRTSARWSREVLDDMCTGIDDSNVTRFAAGLGEPK